LTYSKGLCQPFTVSIKPLVGHHQQYFHRSSYTGSEEHVQFVSKFWSSSFGALLLAIDRHHSKYSYEFGFIADNMKMHGNYRTKAFNRDREIGTAQSVGLERYIVLIKKAYSRKNFYQVGKNKFLLNGMPYLIGGASLDYLSNENVALANEFAEENIQSFLVNSYSASLYLGGGFQFIHKSKHRFDIRLLYCLGLRTMLRNEISYINNIDQVDRFSTYARGSNLTLLDFKLLVQN
jgi:hypothetical protein